MADLSNVVRMLIHQLDATRSYLLPSYCDEDEKARAVIAFAESALAAEPPAPAPAVDGEREELAALIEQTADSHNGLWPGPIIGKLYRAAALLRQPAPAPVPVPVAERPWERPGWCDADGRCWWGRCADEVFNPEWALAPHADIKEFCSDAMPQHCLPHWAIPQPPQGGEVEA